MKTHSYKTIDFYVELEAKRYAEFVGGKLDKDFAGYCVSSKWEHVFFGKEYVGTSHYYYPCCYAVPKYVVTAHVFAYIAGKGNEDVVIQL